MAKLATVHLLSVLCVVLIIISLWLYKVSRSSTVLLFYSPNCPACVSIKSEWDAFEKLNWFGLNLRISKLVDTSLDENYNISNNFKVDTVPAVWLIKNNLRTKYTGSITAADLHKWASDVEKNT